MIAEQRGAFLEVDYSDRIFSIEDGRKEFHKLTDRVYNGERYLLEPGEDAPRLKLIE
ncbi:MAG: hypothetical protein HY512_02200 [Candidatus Aenigmarchaeota archaeon]|nr:hypothetical protein [Candidatus Aenigmarchaeota archaeon]